MSDLPWVTLCFTYCCQRETSEYFTNQLLPIGFRLVLAMGRLNRLFTKTNKYQDNCTYNIWVELSIPGKISTIIYFQMQNDQCFHVGYFPKSILVSPVLPQLLILLQIDYE